MTLPNLNHATGDKEKVTKVKKIYSALTEAVDRAQAIYGPFDTWTAPMYHWDEMYARKITEFMKVSKDCGYESGCWSEGPFYGAYGDEMEDSASRGGYGVLLSDGTAIAFYSAWVLRIRVDIDGPNKGKNQWGNDIFEFDICEDLNDPSAFCNPKNQLLYGYDTQRENPNLSSYATAWVIENGNLDYLKCPDELNWETKTSCE